MNIPELIPHRNQEGSNSFSVSVAFQHDLCDLGEAVIKTRAIQAFDNATTPRHAILGAMSRRKDSASVMYTADKSALEGDEIFVGLITGLHDAFIIEDADHLLQPRTEGNKNLHRILRPSGPGGGQSLAKTSYKTAALKMLPQENREKS